MRSFWSAQDEAVVYELAIAPSALPAVMGRELGQAWERAQRAGAARTRRCFRFLPRDGEALDFVLADRDAASWGEALAAGGGLASERGVSVLIRLLALVAWLAEQGPGAQRWVARQAGGLAVGPDMLRAAAQVALTDAGRFDETGLAALLPPGAARRAM